MSTALTRHVPLLGVLRSRAPGDLKSDVLAGLTTAIMLVPQAMAYAMLAGLEPIVGLYASTVPLAIYGLMGSSRQLAVGPVAMVSLLVASAVAPLAQGDAVLYLALSGTLALMVGVIQLAMGIFRLGFLVKFMSHPVIAGFTSAAALIIGLSQLKHVLGVVVPFAVAGSMLVLDRSIQQSQFPSPRSSARLGGGASAGTSLRQGSQRFASLASGCLPLRRCRSPRDGRSCDGLSPQDCHQPPAVSPQS